MEKRYEGFLAPHGLYILDTHSGEVRFIAHDSNVAIAASASISNGKVDFGTNIPQQANKFSPFENEVITSYPYLIAKPFSDLLKETDARMKCKLMVDTFTAVLKYLALQLASEYIRAKDLKDIQVHQTLTKDLSRPLISAWNLLIARCLPVMKDNKIELFSPEMKVAYEKLESKCKDPFLVTQSYSDENGEIKTKTKKLGKIHALINYRNGLAHGFNQSQTRAKKEFDEYYPLLCDILQEVRFVSRYTLWHVESSREGVNGIRLMGSSPTLNKVDFDREGVNPAISPLFLINDTNGEILPLYAFFDVDETHENGLPGIGKDVFVFEGNTKSTVIYLSSSGEHLEKSSRFQHWKELLAQKQMDVEWADTKNLTLDTLHAIGKHISASGIQALIASAKYLREATIPRQDLNELLDSFSYGGFNGFVMGGESGIGKSTMLAQKTEEWQADGHMVAFYRGSALNQSDIANKFLRDCALKVNYLEDFLSVVHPVISQTDKRCYIIVDALNEYAGDLNELIKSVENMVAQASNYPWFKIIVSIRDSAYNRVTARFGELIPNNYFTVEEEKGGEKIRTNIIRLQPVGKDFVEQLYNAYRDFKWKDNTDSEDEGYYVFRPLTEFNELDEDGTTVKLIRSPLMARLVMQSFHRAKLPQQLTNDDAMRLYHDNIVLEKSDNSLGFPERKKLLSLLVTELDKLNSERIERDILIQHNALRPYLINNQRDSAYIQLLELGVLMEEWEADDCYVRFAFDKFYEFLLAELHWPRIVDAISLMALCKRATSFKILQGAIEIILIRFCLNKQNQQLVTLIDLADKENNEVKELLKDTVVRILVMICNEYPKFFEEIINEFPKQPGEMDLSILKLLSSKLYYSGNLKEFELVIGIALDEAITLKNKVIESDLLLSFARFDYLQGRLDKALKSLESCISINRETENKSGYSNCIITKGVWLLGQGKISQAEEFFVEALEISQELDEKNKTANVLNHLGKIYYKRLDISKAKEFFEKSLEIQTEEGNLKGLCSSLNSLSTLHRDEGEFDKAELLTKQSLEIYRKLGDKLGIKNCLNALGIVYYNFGDFNKSTIVMTEALELSKQFGDKQGISIQLSNLAVLLMEQGSNTEAKDYFLQSIEIKNEIKKRSQLIADIHRVYALLSKEEKSKYYFLAMDTDRTDFNVKEDCWLNVLDMYNILDDNKTDVKAIMTHYETIIGLVTASKLTDVDDLPVEAFYVAAKKLIQLNAPEEAKELAKMALDWIGGRKTRRKEELERMINSTAYNSV